MFDAILIDGGQDLVVRDELKYQDKQPIYWMAWQALRPVDDKNPLQKRLIWAYDEAQNLHGLNIATAKELFGEEYTKLVQGLHRGGIQKSIIMKRCYRTPHPILTAAHAIGMGLLRSEGMLSGYTRKNDWENIGYQVTGNFNNGQKITLHRPSENSPNPMPEISDVPVLQFNVFESREAELNALAKNLENNLENDGLKPSRNILVVVLGSNRDEAVKLQKEVAEFLIAKGIPIYIPTARNLNDLDPNKNNRDSFWQEGGVTISLIHRAKGNEAEMVYVVGFDRIAENESKIKLRNAIFVALTRARGWAVLSGIGEYPMYDEMRQVIASGDSFTFTYRQPSRNLGE
jgi:superfamily I DNA and RNA helicase